MIYIIYIAAFIVTLGILIAFHEFGHFWVARRLGVKVIRFSVGFGKPLWLRRGKDGTEYAIAAVPLGGYVRMLDEREGDVDANERHRAFNQQSVWVRIAIVSAGPIFNFILAILIYAIMYVAGTEAIRPLFSAPIPDSIAAQGGFQDGDLIVRIDQQETLTLNAALLELVDRSLSNSIVEIEVADSNQHQQIRTLDFRGIGDLTEDGKLLTNLGLNPWRVPFPAVIDKVEAGSPAEQAGLQSGDRVISLNGKSVEDWIGWAQQVRSKPNERLTLVIDRNGNEVSLEITPEAVETDRNIIDNIIASISQLFGAEPETAKMNDKTVGRVGAYAKIPENISDNRILIHYGPLEALLQGTVKTWDTSVFTLRMLGRMLIGQVSLKNISGPITIAQFAGQSAMIGLTAFLSFMALVSISLGVLNLLPVPILDGGHLLYYLIEIIKGSPLSDAKQYLGQQIGLAMIVMLMGLALFNDFTRQIG